MSIRAQLELRGDWAWPKHDEMCFPYLMEVEADIPAWIMERVPGRRTVVQAGGNCGVYAKEYAAAFERVVTFEPEAKNFFCLLHNTDCNNVFAYRAFLSNQAGQAPLAEDSRNGGGHYLWTDPLPKECTGVSTKVPVMRLDDPRLTAVDLVHLDIEGHEAQALKGALDTIFRCRPWIAFEVRNALQIRSGNEPETLGNLMVSWDYELAETYKHEALWKPRGS